MGGLKRELKIEQRACIMKCFSILDTTGTPTLAVGGQDGTIVDNGVGDYTITFTEPFTRLIGSQVSVKEADGLIHIAAESVTAIQVVIFEADGVTAEDASCNVWVMGSMASDET